MLFREIARIIGHFLYGFSVALLVPLALAIYFEHIQNPILHPQPHSTDAFLWTLVISVVTASLFAFLGRKASGHFFRREGLAAVVFIWLLTPVIGAMPFYLSDTIKNPVHAYFEAVSGLTTTSATVMAPEGTIDPVKDSKTGKVLFEGIEAVSKALLFWRSFLQFLGGGGILILFVAILPALGVGGKVLFQAEVAGPLKDSLTPRIKETALQLSKIYLFLIGAETIILLVTNHQMPFFDALTTSFSTISTGGFSVRNESIGAYHNALTEWVVILFMFLGATSFSLFFHLFRGRFFRIYEPEFLIYFLIISLSSAFVAWQLGDAIPLGDAIRQGTFQVVSAQTTTGFFTADYNSWPYAVQMIMLVVMYVGGMSGSTSSGIKVIRFYMIFRILQSRVESLFRPEAVRTFRIADREVDQRTSTLVLSLFVAVVALSILAIFFFILDGIDPKTSIALTACFFNNAGPTAPCAFLSDTSALFASLWMILGRLEVFAVLLLLIPSFWRQHE